MPWRNVFSFYLVFSLFLFGSLAVSFLDFKFSRFLLRLHSYFPFLNHTLDKQNASCP